MEDKQKEFSKKINVDKAYNKLKIAKILIIISIITYIPPLITEEFDFGIVFETISLILLIKSQTYMNKYNESQALKYNIFAILPVGWLLIYDVFVFLSNTSIVLDFAFLPFDYINEEILSIGYILLLIEINNDLLKAGNPTKYKESTDWFYERYEDKKKK